MKPAEFFDWWRGQLTDLVPDRLRQSWQRGKNTVTIRIDAESVAFTGPSGETTSSYRLPGDESSIQPSALQDFLAKLPGPPDRLRLVLQPGLFLRRDLTMPRAASPHLAEAVSYQMPKLTPFSADQALYACGVKPGGPSDKPLAVWLVALPRARVEWALALINQPLPSNPMRLEQPPQPGEPLEFSWRVVDPSSGPSRHMRAAWVGLALLWAAAVAMHLHSRHDAYQRLDETLSELRVEAAQAGALRDRLNATAAQLESLSERKRSTPSALAVLDSLAQLLDDETWLQRLDFDGKDLTLLGVSAAPSELVEALENSSTFQGVRFDAFTRDRRNEADRFNLSATIEAPPLGGEQ